MYFIKRVKVKVCTPILMMTEQNAAASLIASSWFFSHHLFIIGLLRLAELQVKVGVGGAGAAKRGLSLPQEGRRWWSHRVDVFGGVPA